MGFVVRTDERLITGAVKGGRWKSRSRWLLGYISSLTGVEIEREKGKEEEQHEGVKETEIFTERDESIHRSVTQGGKPHPAKLPVSCTHTVGCIQTLSWHSRFSGLLNLTFVSSQGKSHGDLTCWGTSLGNSPSIFLGMNQWTLYDAVIACISHANGWGNICISFHCMCAFVCFAYRWWFIYSDFFLLFVCVCIAVCVCVVGSRERKERDKQKWE